MNDKEIARRMSLKMSQLLKEKPGKTNPANLHNMKELLKVMKACHGQEILEMAEASGMFTPGGGIMETGRKLLQKANRK